MTAPNPTGPRIGPYVAVGMLGQGSMGVVYRAHDPSLGRDVALKLIKSEAADQKQLKRFEREGQITASLRHPGIVSVHSAGVIDGAPYLAYELIEGAQTLEDAFPKASLEQRVNWLRDAARAVGHAHRQGVIHRDLKPENLLLDAHGQVKVADFGLALAEGSGKLTRTGTTVGSPLYMSPEQIQGQRERLVPASDVWSLGVSLYQALTGRDPFTGANFTELARAICAAKPQRPSAFNEDVPPALARVCLQALQEDPAQRPADGEVFAQLIDRALRGEIPVSPPSSRALVVLVCLALASAGVAAYTVWTSRLEQTSLGREGTAAVLTAVATTSPSASPAPAKAPAATRQSLSEAAQAGDLDALLELAQLHACGRDGPRDEARALELWRRAAATGQARALLALGRAHELGIGLPADGNEAAALYKRAAEAGDRLAAVQLGRLFQIGYGVPRDEREAKRWYSRATGAGDLEGLRAVGLAHLEGPVRDTARGVQFLRRAARKGHAPSMLDLGRVAGSPGVDLDPAEVKQWLLAAWEAGQADAAELLAGISEQPEQALEWLQRGSEAGSLSTRGALAFALRDGDYGLVQDETAARRELELLVEDGYPYAGYELAFMAEQGRGGASDPARALELFRCAANGGSADAAHELGSAYDDGKLGLEENAELASAWYLRAARSGCAYAMKTVASRYRQGKGVPLDPERALLWLRLGAQARRSWACYDLAQAYLEGQLGLTPNGKLAEQWHKAGAELGNEWCMYELGQMYLDGNGVGQDASRGVTWLGHAVEAGNGFPIYTLIRLLETGEEGVRDPEAARRYFQIGAQGIDWKSKWATARCHAEGLGTERDLDAALRVYRELKAAESLASAPASLEAARLLMLAERYEEVAAWLQEPAEAGHHNASTQLGRVSERTVDGRPEDSAQALKWYLRAAALKGIRGLTLAARRLEQGRDVPVDRARAAEMLAEAERLVDARVGEDPGETAVRVLRSELYVELGRYPEAVDDLQALGPGPLYARRGYLARAGAQTWLDVTQARADLDAALELSPGEGEALACRARLRAFAGDHEGASADCQVAAKRRWFPARVHAVRGLLQLQADEPAQALPHCERAQEQTGGFCEEAWAVSALAHARLSDSEAARRDAERALSLTRANPLVWTLAGEALALAGDEPRAADCFRQALEVLGSEHPLATRCQDGQARLQPR